MCETPDQIISAINALSVPARKELSQKVHNTTEGRAAYIAFNYGMGEPASTADDGNDNTGDNGSSNDGGTDNGSGGDTGNGSGDSNSTTPTNQTVVNHYENHYSETNETNTTTNTETNSTTNTTTTSTDNSETNTDDHSTNSSVSPTATGVSGGDANGAIEQNSIATGDGALNNNAVQVSDADGGTIPQNSPLVGDVNMGSPVVEGSTVNPTIEGPLIGDTNNPITVGDGVPPIQNDSPVNSQVALDIVDTDMGDKIADSIIRKIDEPMVSPSDRLDEEVNKVITGGGE